MENQHWTIKNQHWTIEPKLDYGRRKNIEQWKTQIGP